MRHRGHVEPRDGRVVGGDLLTELQPRDGSGKSPTKDPVIVEDRLDVLPKQALKLAKLLGEKRLVVF